MHIATLVALALTVGVHIATSPLLVTANITCRRRTTMFLVVDCYCCLTTTSWLWTVRSIPVDLRLLELELWNWCLIICTLPSLVSTGQISCNYCLKVVSEAWHTSKVWVKVKSLIPNSLSFRTLSFIPRFNLSFIKLCVRLPKTHELLMSLRPAT